MSIELNAKIICDGCCQEICAPPEHRATHLCGPISNAKAMAINSGWVSVSRGRYLPKAHYCKACSDKPQKPISKKAKPVSVRHVFYPDF